MAASQHARTLDAPHNLERLAIDNHNVLTVSNVQELLFRVRGQRQIPCKWRIGFDSCFTNLPSFVNVCTRRFSRSATYTIPSLATRMACTMLKFCGPAASAKLGLGTSSQWSSSTGLLAKAPHIRLNAQMSA